MYRPDRWIPRPGNFWRSLAHDSRAGSSPTPHGGLHRWTLRSLFSVATSVAAIVGVSVLAPVTTAAATSGAGVCDVSGTNGATVDYTAAGNCVIDANQAGDADYLAAPTVSLSVTVAPGGCQ